MEIKDKHVYVLDANNCVQNLFIYFVCSDAKQRKKVNPLPISFSSYTSRLIKMLSTNLDKQFFSHRIEQGLLLSFADSISVSMIFQFWKIRSDLIPKHLVTANENDRSQN